MKSSSAKLKTSSERHRWFLRKVRATHIPHPTHIPPSPPPPPPPPPPRHPHLHRKAQLWLPTVILCMLILVFYCQTCDCYTVYSGILFSDWSNIYSPCIVHVNITVSCCENGVHLYTEHPRHYYRPDGHGWIVIMRNETFLKKQNNHFCYSFNRWEGAIGFWDQRKALNCM